MTSAIKDISRSLRADPDVRAACVLGSVARGDADAISDLDLLAVIEDEPPAASRVKRLVPQTVDGRSVQMRVITAPRLADLASKRTVYAAHVALESRPLFDRRRDLHRLRRAFPRGTRLEETAEPLRRRLALYEELDWCGGHFLLCFADLYAFGRAGAILALGREGIFDFGRSSPFRRLAELSPALAEEAMTVLALEPFYVRARRGTRITPPFPARGSQREAEHARDACREILNALP